MNKFHETRRRTLATLLAMLILLTSTSVLAVFVTDAQTITLTPGANLIVDGTTKYGTDVNPDKVNMGFKNVAKTKYYLVTGDASRIGTNTVTYNGVDYPIDGVLYAAAKTVPGITGNWVDLYNDVKLPGAGATAPGIMDYRAQVENMTFFFDPGNYLDGKADGENYTNMSHTNTAYVGLGATPDAVVFAKLPKADGTLQRYNLMYKDMYFANITFDAMGKNMDSAPKFGQTMFFITGGNDGAATDGFVMKKVNIRNVGASNKATANKNTAIHVYQNKGTVIFEDVTITNVKTVDGLGVVYTNQAKDIYVKGLTVDLKEAAPRTALSSGAFPFKVEHSNTTAVPLAEQMVVISSLTVNNPATQPIYVQDYNYRSVHLPANYKYAAYLPTNGIANTFFSAYNSFVLPGLPTETADREGIAKDHAFLDISDNSWIVYEGLNISVTDQITKVLEVVGNINANSPGAVPTANIKLVVDGPSYESFEVKYPATVAKTGADVRIVAVKTPTTQINGTGTDTNKLPLIPMGATETIILPTQVDPITLHNFDFESIAEYTATEAIKGNVAITAPNLNDDFPAGDANYPYYAKYSKINPARVTNSTATTFVNCSFKVLAAELAIDQASPLDLPQGSAQTLTAKLTKAFTAEGINVVDLGKIDDPTIQWFSTDPTIATVDKTSGKVTAVGLGSCKIYAKAVDKFNQGEIEKPFAFVTLNVKDKPVTPPTTPPTTGTPIATAPNPSGPYFDPNKPAKPNDSRTDAATPLVKAPATAAATNPSNLPKTGERSTALPALVLVGMGIAAVAIRLAAKKR